MDDPDISKDTTDSPFLTASDLVAFRKRTVFNEDHPRNIIGEKFNSVNHSPEEGTAVLESLKNFKETLKQNRAAKMCDLIPAIWNENLNVCLVEKLKGKMMQHMGQPIGCKIALSPEEATFLLENGSIEITHKDRPLSTEDAYNLMLNKHMALEKYQVYSHLSQLGFIVVPHQKKLDGCFNEKKINLDKRKIKRKRNPENNAFKGPPEKRLNFSGAFSNNSSQETSESANKESEIKDIDCDSKSEEINERQENTQRVEDAKESAGKCQETIASTSQSMITDTQQSCELPEEMAIPERDISTDVPTESNNKRHSTDPSNCEIPDTDISTDVPNCEIRDTDISTDVPNCKISDTDISTDVPNCEIVENSESTVLSEPNAENNDPMDVDTQFSVVSSADESNSKESTGTDDSIRSIPKSDEDDSNMCVIDSASCSDEESREVGDEDDGQMDDEVEVLEVAKVEKTPLAVIDLLSDGNESEDDDKNEDSDEEIKVLSVVQSTVSEARNKLQDCKKEFKFPKKDKMENVREAATFRIEFPDLYRHDTVCVARPPLNLLPNNVRPAKEAYILNSRDTTQTQNNSSGRVWNSWRDLQQPRSQSQFNNQSRGSRFRRSYHKNYNSSQAYNRNVTSAANYSSRNGSSNGIFPDPQSYLGSAGLSSHPNSNNGINPVSRTLTNSSYMPLSTTVPPIPSYHSFNPNSAPMPPFGSIPGSMPGAPTPLVGSMPGMHPTTFISPNAMQEYIQRTAFSVASNLIASMFGQQPNQSLLGNPFQPNHPFGDRFAHGPRRQSSFPCDYPAEGRNDSWRDVRANVQRPDPLEDLDPGSDIEEVPVDPNDVLWDTKGICPLVKAGTRYPEADVLQSLQVTQNAKLIHKLGINDKCLPTTCSLEISFDVYLPGTSFKKTCPDIPKHRIIVVRSSDPVPKYSDLAFLQRQWTDGAMLQVAVVDNGDISFFSMTSVSLPVIIPHSPKTN